MKFNTEGLQEVRFIVRNINFPVAIAIYSEWEKVQYNYLMRNIGKFSTEDICKWCVSHNINYEIVYPLSLWTIIKNPYKYYQYLKMKSRLKSYSFAGA